MTDMSLVAEPREIIGKKVKRLRRDGLVPAVLYGSGEPQHVQLATRDLSRVLRFAGSNDLIDVDVAGKKHRVLVRDVQRHVTRGDLLHVDFLTVDMTQKMSAEATVILTGISPFAESGDGVVNQVLFAINIEALPDDLVSEIEVDVSSIVDVNSQILVSELGVPEGIEILDDPNDPVVTGALARAALEEEEEEEVDELLDFEEEGDEEGFEEAE